MNTCDVVSSVFLKAVLWNHSPGTSPQILI
jgi:hypothetical protein